MTKHLAAADLERVETLLQKASGILLSKNLRRTLQASFSNAAAELGLDESEFLRRLLAEDQSSITCLVEHSVIGETYFFRHPEQFAALKSQLTNELANQAVLRVWSAGCSTGEETYSLAMALLDAGRKRSRDLVIGTDICQRSLSTARQAIYGHWSLRRITPQIREQYFYPVNDQQVQVIDPVRSHVEFRQHNLLLDPPPSSEGFHIILCRNVFIYFTSETIALVLHRLAGSLLPGGLLVLGPVEIPHAAILPLEWIEINGATILRKPLPHTSITAMARHYESARKNNNTGSTFFRISLGHRSSHPRCPAKALSATKEDVFVPAVPAGKNAITSSANKAYEMAREAARHGRLDEAERLAMHAVSEEMNPESFLLLSMAAESRGDLTRAEEQARKAIYLDAGLATGHALLVALYQRMGRIKDAKRARRNALLALKNTDESTVLRGVEAITAGALRRALEQAAPSTWPKEDA